MTASGVMYLLFGLFAVMEAVSLVRAWRRDTVYRKIALAYQGHYEKTLAGALLYVERTSGLDGLPRFAEARDDAARANPDEGLDGFSRAEYWRETALLRSYYGLRPKVERWEL
jgi:hypothetical protein